MLASLGLALVFLAHFDLAEREFSPVTLILLVVGVGLALTGAMTAELPATIADEEEDRPMAEGVPREWTRWRLLALPAVAVFTLMAFSLSEFNRFTAQGAIVWGLAVFLFVAVWWQPVATEDSLWSRLRGAVATVGRQPQSIAVVIGGVLLVGDLAAFFRFYSLDTFPADAGALEAGIGDGVRGIMNGDFYVFMPREVGEGGLLYVTAGAAKLFGVAADYNAIKVASAMAGLLAVGATYLLLRELFADRLVAVIGALLMAVAHWPVTLSRSSFSAAAAPFFAAITLLFLVRALKRGHVNDFLVCGLLTGLGLYFYEGLRVMPPLIAVCVVVKGIAVLSSNHKLDIFPLVGRSLLLGITVLIIFAPMARAWHDQPEAYLRTLGAGSEPRGYDISDRFIDNAGKLPLMFGWEGDADYRNGVPEAPALDGGMAALLTVGILLAGASWLRYGRGMFPYAAVALVALLVPSALNLAEPSRNPSLTLASGAIPLVFGFAAVPLAFVVSAVAQPLSARKGLVAGLLIVIAVTAAFAVSNYRGYFDDYRDSFDAQALPTSEVAAAIEDARARDPRIDNVFVATVGDWTDFSAVSLILGQPAWLDGGISLPEALEDPSAGREDLYLVQINDWASIIRLMEKFPQGISEQREIEGSDTPFFLFTASR